MLRVLQESAMKPNDTMNRASTDMITGMGVVKNLEDKEVAFPATESGVNIYILDKERIPTTIVNAVRTDVSDYDPDFNEFKAGDFVKLNPPQFPDRFAVDQYVLAGLAIGNYMAVGTDGKWKIATVPSMFTYGGIHNDAGHELAIIQTMSAVGSN